MERVIRVGTRGSSLALSQTKQVIERAALSNYEIIIIRTEGDDLSADLTKPIVPGVFVNSLRTALISNQVDLIVHSLKDLPSAPFPGISTAAIPYREDPRDALVSRDYLNLDQLAPGSRIGTSSPRRSANIRQRYPHLDAVAMRGNVDSRIKQVREGLFDGAILAVAGLSRIDRLSEITEYFETTEMCPAPGQGALSLECREDDNELIEILAKINDAGTRIAVTAERAVLQRLQAGCDLPLGAHATLDGLHLTLHAQLGQSHGAQNEISRGTVELTSLTDFDAAVHLGYQVADDLRTTNDQ